MSKTVKWILIIGGIIVFLGAIVALIFYLSPSTPQVIYQPGGGGPTTAPCVPFTQGQYDSAVKSCNSKCGRNLSVPVVGVGLYAQCLSKCKAQINNGYGVVMC